MGELRSALDALATIDLQALSADERLAFIAEASAGVNRLEAIRSRAVRVADAERDHQADGAVSMKAWLRGTCRLAPSDASAIVSSARRLAKLPAVTEAFEAGAITSEHVRVITKAMTKKRLAKAEEIGVEIGETDRILAVLACTTQPPETAAGVRRWVQGVDPDGSLDDAADVQRSISLAKTMDGRVDVRGWLDAVGGEYLHTALAAVMNGDRPAGDTRSFRQRQGDALVLLARDALGSDRLPDVRGERPQVRVGIDLTALCAERAAPGVAGGELAFAGPITPETARRVACDASVVRIITGPDGLPLDVGRAQRTATAAIRKAVEARDGHCVFIWCGAPPEWCDVHHVIHWAHGGPTSCENGALLCERHHTACHEGGFRVARDPGTSQWRTYRPDGTEIRPRGDPEPTIR
jgi:Domain of unknown function (DUF222)